MDGGARQEEMAEQIKREVKQKAHRRREDRIVPNLGGHVSVFDGPDLREITSQHGAAGGHTSPVSDASKTTTVVNNNDDDDMDLSLEPRTRWLQSGSLDMPSVPASSEGVSFGKSDSVLFLFYIEYLHPFLFPFYRPSLLYGGRAWILEMMMSTSVVRQTALCHSSYFFSLARQTAKCDFIWDKVLAQSKDAFEELRESLRRIDSAPISDHLHCAVRVMASIIQVQRFEIAVLSFHNCQAHLNAGVALFRQLLGSDSTDGGAKSRFDAVMGLLSDSPMNEVTQCLRIPSAEQAALRFSATVIMLDDIIASTALQEQPRLYEFHQSFLSSVDNTQPLINMEPITGCKNWVILQIGEIASLDAWKKQRKAAGNLDVMELVRRATSIKDVLVSQLSQLEASTTVVSRDGSNLLDVFIQDNCQQRKTLDSMSTLVTRVWGHAALIYLYVVVSGWQPANGDVRYHVGQVLDLLRHLSPMAMLRTMVWPFCVAGCLAEPSQEAQIRGMVGELQPASVFGTTGKALEIMENAWRTRDAGVDVNHDLAACFRCQGNLILLV
jgi:hypothetical protein